VNIAIKASDPRVHVDAAPEVINDVAAGGTATFDVTFTGDGRPHRFDLQFVRDGTNVVLGSIPVVIGTPIQGDGYEYEDLEDGEISEVEDFGSWVNPLLPTNTAPTFTRGAAQSTTAGSGPVTVSGWATGMSTGAAGETDQLLDFVVGTDNDALFTAPPTIGPDGTLTYAPAPGASGRATVTVRLHDSGGTVGGGQDTSPTQTFTIDVAPAAPLSVTTQFDYLTREALVVDFGTDVAAAFGPGLLQVTNASTGAAVTPKSVVYDPATHQATVTFDPAALPDGNYRLTIVAGALPGLAADHHYDFFVLAGDANHDRAVNFNDLLLLAKNYNATGANFARGDLNYDGVVNFDDLLILAKNYNKTLAAPAPAAAPPVAAAAPAVLTAPATAAAMSAATPAATSTATPVSVLHDDDSARKDKKKPVFSNKRIAKPAPAKPAPVKAKAAAQRR